MDKETILENTAKFAEKTLAGEATGHDWWHVYRVNKLARTICESENDADSFIVSLAALLHDIADHKFHNGDHTVGEKVSRDWLSNQDVDTETIKEVLHCISVCSYSNGLHPESKEAEIVQDADRLDALGAIGLARVFATGVHFGQIFYDPNQPKESQKTTTGHFYEKLFELETQMNTSTGKEIARERSAYLNDYLDRFYLEWEGEK